MAAYACSAMLKLDTGFEPICFVDADHYARLVVELLIPLLNPQGRCEVPSPHPAEEVTAIARKAVASVPTKVGLLDRANG